MSRDIEPRLVAEFMTYISSLGDWAHGGDVSKTVDDWMFTGIDFDMVVGYLESGCYDPVSASQLYHVGVYGDDLTETVSDDDGISLGYAFANNDITLAEVLTRIGR